MLGRSGLLLKVPWTSAASKVWRIVSRLSSTTAPRLRPMRRPVPDGTRIPALPAPLAPEGDRPKGPPSHPGEQIVSKHLRAGVGGGQCLVEFATKLETGPFQAARPPASR
jgi:hypothetical protein